MEKLHILVDNLGANQISYTITKALNDLHSLDQVISPVVYYMNMHRHSIRPLFPTMSIVEAWMAHGPMISTSLGTTISMLSFPGPSKKVFYLYDLEWMRTKQRYFTLVYNILHDKNIMVVTRSNMHSTIVSNLFHKDSDYITDNFKEVIKWTTSY